MTDSDSELQVIVLRRIRWPNCIQQAPKEQIAKGDIQVFEPTHCFSVIAGCDLPEKHFCGRKRINSLWDNDTVPSQFLRGDWRRAGSALSTPRTKLAAEVDRRLDQKRVDKCLSNASL